MSCGWGPNWSRPTTQTTLPKTTSIKKGEEGSRPLDRETRRAIYDKQFEKEMDMLHIRSRYQKGGAWGTPATIIPIAKWIWYDSTGTPRKMIYDHEDKPMGPGWRKEAPDSDTVLVRITNPLIRALL